MIWHAGIAKAGAVLQSLFGWIIAGLAVALVAAGFYVRHINSELDKARNRLAASNAAIAQCVQANESASATIDALIEVAEENAALRQQALDAQRAAVARIQELEARNREPEIIRIREAAGSDSCAGAPLPDALRLRIAPADRH